MLKLYSRMRPAFFSAPDTGTNGGGAGDNQPDGQGKAGEDEAAKQAELNKKFAERAARAAEAERKKIFETLGVKDDEELKAIVDAKRQADEKNKGDLEKLADQAKKASEKADKVERESADKIASMKKRLLDSEIKRIAGQPVKDKDGKVLRPAFRQDAIEEEVLLLISRGEITEDEATGTYSGIEKALEALAKKKAYLLTEQSPEQRQSWKKPEKPGGPTNNNDKNPDRGERILTSF